MKQLPTYPLAMLISGPKMVNLLKIIISILDFIQAPTARSDSTV